MKKIHYIATDVDGTLLDDHDHYDIDRLNRLLIDLRQRSIFFIVASGNSYDALKVLFAHSPLVRCFVAENGGRIIVNGHEYLSKIHQRSVIADLLTTVKSLTRQPDLLSLSGSTQTFIADQYRDVPVPFYPHHSYFKHLADVSEPIYNLNLNWYAQRPAVSWIQEVVYQLNRAFPQINATYSGAFGIDVLPVGVNKAVSLRYLIEKLLGGTIDNLAAFGDTSNDIEMISEAGVGYAMKNATPDLMAVADQITTFDNNHQGLLNELEKIITYSDIM